MREIARKMPGQVVKVGHQRTQSGKIQMMRKMRHCFGQFTLTAFPAYRFKQGQQAEGEVGFLDELAAHHHRQRVGMSRSEEHTSELQSQSNLVCRLLLEKKNQ